MYQLNFSNLGYALINKSDGNLYKIYQPQYTGLPYSEITYESYSEIEGYKLPRKITILSADGNSKVLFQVRSLEINPDNLNLSITIPDDIPVQRL